MSVYNGFTTRAQESKYGQLCEMLVSLLSTKLVKLMKGEKSDNAQFSKQFTAIYSKMLKFESIKYLPPKLSANCGDLAEFCMANYENNRSSSSSLGEEVPASPKVTKTFSPISAYPLEQINEEVVRPAKKRLVFVQEKTSRPNQSNFENYDMTPNSYYEKVMDKYIKLSNKYAPKGERSFSVGNREAELFYKDGIFFKS
jgi:hypothetical protein